MTVLSLYIPIMASDMMSLVDAGTAVGKCQISQAGGEK